MSGQSPPDDGSTEDTASRTGDRPTILAVDDEDRVVQAFDLWLGDTYRILTATSGEEALDILDETVDLVLLDRHMPGMSGDEVLEEIRSQDYDCRVAMVTAVDPDFDIVDMPFDHYVSKPLDEQALREVVERLLRLDAYDRQLTELYRVVQKIVTLEDQLPARELREDERYMTLLDREEQLQAETEELVTSLDREELEDLFEQAGPGT